MATPGSKRIAIIGAGPIGLEVAAYARRLGYTDIVVYERGDVADNVRSWSFVPLFSPWHMNTTSVGWDTVRQIRPSGPGIDPKICPTGGELREKYLLPLAQSLGSSLRVCTQVLSIGRDDLGTSGSMGESMTASDRGSSPFRLLVRDGAGRERIDKADILFDCSGTYGHHRWAGRGGIPAPGERALEQRIWYQLPDVLGKDRARFLGKHTLLLGAGYSAATILEGLAHLHQVDSRTRVSWAIRRIGQALQAIHNDPLPARASLVKRSLEIANQPPSWLQYLGNCVLEKIEGGAQIGVTLKYVETDLALVVDEVVALVGYMPDSSIYEQLLLQRSYAAGPLPPPAVLQGDGSSVDLLQADDILGSQTLLNPEPNFFVLGAKSFGTNSSFLMLVGHKQVREAFRILAKDPALDLYADPELADNS